MDDVIEILGSDTEDERDDELKNMFGHHMGRTISKQELFERINDEDDSEQEDYLELLREIEEDDQIIPQPQENEQYFVDLTTWPKTADNIEDALAKYNDIGLLKKIQFKKMS